jgi:iron complex transport system substrate-binding protein
VSGLAALLALCAAADGSGALRLGPKVPAKVERVVTLAPSLTDTVLRLGAGARLVGVSRFDEAPEVAKLPRVGGFIDPSVESVVALKPQLLVVQKAPGNRQAVEKIAELGVPVLALPLTKVEDVLDAITQIAAALGVDGHALTGHIEEARARVREAGKSRKARAKVLLVYGFKPLVVAGPDSFAGQLLDDIGAVNIAEKAPSAYPVFSAERAVALQPDVVIDCSDVADGRADLKTLMTKSRWVELKSRALLQPGPSLAEGLQELERAVYP